MADNTTLSAFQFHLTLTAMKYKLLKFVIVRSTAFITEMGQKQTNRNKIFPAG